MPSLTYPPSATRGRYGTALVPGTLRSDHTLACVTPSALDAGVSRRLHLDFAHQSFLPPGVTLLGDAFVDRGVLELTSAMHHEHGALLITATDTTRTDPWPWARFELRVKVYIGDGEWFCTYDEAKGGRVCGGEGFSFSYGALPTASLGQLGAGSGLRVVFHTGPRNGPAIDVSYDHVRIQRRALVHLTTTGSSGDGGGGLSAGWPRGTWVNLRIAYDSFDSPGGLLLERDGHFDFRALPVPGWAPQREWKMALAATTGLAVDRHLFDDLVLSTDALIRPARVEVEVSA